MPETGELGRTVSELLILMWLGKMTCEDIKRKRIKQISLILGVGIAVISFFLTGEISLTARLLGMMVGVVLLLVSHVSDGRIGRGDSMVSFILGMSMGVMNLLVTLSGAFAVAAIYAAVLLLTGRANGKSAFPFVPFIFGSYCMLIVLSERWI